MWTAPLFTDLFRALDPRPCAMPTYSRSTMLRVTLLLAGFYVGVGHATGEKEETTIAANTLGINRRTIGRPLAATRAPFQKRRADVGTSLPPGPPLTGNMGKAAPASAVCMKVTEIYLKYLLTIE